MFWKVRAIPLCLLQQRFTSKVVAVNHYNTTGWLVDTGKQVKDSCFTVRTNDANLR